MNLAYIGLLQIIDNTHPNASKQINLLFLKEKTLRTFRVMIYLSLASITKASSLSFSSSISEAPDLLGFLSISLKTNGIRETLVNDHLLYS